MKMGKLSALAAVALFLPAVAGTVAGTADPKVGCTIALAKSNYLYQSNAFFRERPIAGQMIKDGIDLCWYEGWGGEKGKSKSEKGKSAADAVESLKQFNAIWLITEHEAECPHPAAETAAALKAYVEAGGGLVFCFSAGRYPEAPVDAYWTEVMRTFGAEILHEEIFNPETEVKVDKRRNMFYTSDFSAHPVTAGIPGLWLADRSGGTMGSVAVKYSSDWQVVVRGGKGAKSVPKNRRTNAVEAGKAGFYSHDAPIVAVRQFGRGRIVFIASHKDSCGWMYNIDKWPNYTERGTYQGKVCDMVGLVENALRWASEPSAGDAAFVKHYRPVEPEIPPYRPQPDFGLRELEKPNYPANVQPANRTIGARGLVGVRSSHSDGTSSVAEYVAAAKAAGLNFLVFADPLEHLTAEKLAALRADCAANSSDDFYCCPGVEYVDSSDCVWALWHDKVEFPDPKPFLRDGRYYQMFDGKKILQRNQYGGHQNLYRGVLLNMKRVEDIGNDLINLAYFNAVAPKVHEVDRLVVDNDPYYLKTGHNLHRAATVSYTRVRSAADVMKAAKAAVTCGDDLKAIRTWANAKGGWGGQETGAKAHLQAVYGAGVEIRGFDVVRAQGTDVEHCALRVICPAGVAEVTVHDGNRRVLARFDAKGVKDFATTFDFLHDRQMVLILAAKGMDGSEVVSNSKWLSYYHAGMMRCGDNSNLLSQNPNVMMFLNWDDSLVWPYKKIFTSERHNHVSEHFLWEACHQIPSREPTSGCWGEYSRVRVRGSDYPSEKAGFPSSHTVSTLNQPNVVSIFDQYLGEFIMDPTRTEKNATYSMCSPVRKLGEGRYWRRHHRVYQFVDRHDGWWKAVYRQEAPGYRGGYTVVEGEIDFMEPCELAAPVDLVRIDARNPAKDVDVYSRGADVFRAGSYHALHASDEAWYGFFGLKGADDLHVNTFKSEGGLRSVLQIGKAGEKFVKGDKLSYRFAVGSFVEPPRGGAYCEWFARMMDGTGFNHGDTPVNGIIELGAKDGKAELTAGSTWFIQNYPVRISGLVDNGCAYLTDGGCIWRPIAFSGKNGYAAIPLEERKTWTFQNLFVADNPDLRFTWVPKLPGHDKETLEIFNNTAHDITSRVRDVRTGETFAVTVGAGEKVCR